MTQARKRFSGSKRLPRIPAAARWPRSQRLPDHGDLSHVVAIVRHHLPEYRLKRSCEFRISLMHGFDGALHLFRRRIRQRSKISQQAGKLLP